MLILNLPYVIFGLVCTNFGEAWRMAEGSNASEKVLSLMTTLGTAFGNPLPSFEGEPKAVAISGDMDTFGDMIWNSLNEDNKVSLFVRYIDIATGETSSKIYNKNA